MSLTQQFALLLLTILAVQHSKCTQNQRNHMKPLTSKDEFEMDHGWMAKKEKNFEHNLMKRFFGLLDYEALLWPWLDDNDDKPRRHCRKKTYEYTTQRTRKKKKRKDNFSSEIRELKKKWAKERREKERLAEEMEKLKKDAKDMERNCTKGEMVQTKPENEKDITKAITKKDTIKPTKGINITKPIKISTTKKLSRNTTTMTEPNYEYDHTNSEGVDTTNRPEGHFYEWKSEYQKEYNGTIFQVGPWNETKPTSEEEFSLELTSVYHQSPGLKNERIRRPIKRKNETDEEHPSDPNCPTYVFQSEYEEPNTTNKPTRNTTGTEEEVSSEFLSVNNQDPEFNNKPIRKPERWNQKDILQKDESIITDEPQSEATEPNYESDHTNSEGVDTTNRPEGHFYEWKSEYQKEYNGTIFQVGPWNETKPTSEEESSLEFTSVYHQSPGLKNERIRRPIKRKNETDEEHPSDPNCPTYVFQSEYEEPNTTNKPTRNTTGTEEEVSSEFLSVNNQDPEFNNKPIRKPERWNQKDILQKDESIITDEPQSEATEPNYESDHTNSEGVDTTNRPEGHFYEWKSEYQKEYNGTIFQVGPWNETKPTSEEESSLEFTSVYHQSPGLKNERIRRPIKRKNETDEEHPSDPNCPTYVFQSEYEEPNTTNKPTRNTTGTEEEVSSEFLSVNNQDPEFNNKPIRKPERWNQKDILQKDESIITDEPQSEATEPNYESDHTNSEGVDATNRPEGHFYEWKSEYQKEYNGIIFQVGPWNETKPTSEEESSLEFTSVYHQSPGLKNERIRRPIKRKHETDEEHPSDPNHLIYDFKSEYEEPNTTNKPTRNTTGTEEEVSSEFLSVNNQDPEFNNKPIRKPERWNQKDILQKDESIITDEPQSEATEPNYESDHTNSEGVDTTNRPEGHFYEWKSEYQKEYNGTIFQVGPWNETKPTSEEESSLELTSVYHQSPGLKNERIRRPIKRKHETDEEHPSDPNHLIYDFKSEYEEPNTTNKPTRNTTGTEEEVSSEFFSVNNQDPEFNNKPIRKPERCNQKDILQKDESIITDEPQSEATEPNYESDHTNSEGVDTTNRPEGHFYEWKSEYQKEYNGTIGPWNETKPTSEEEFSLELTSVYHQSPGLKNERIRRPIKRKHETDEEHPSDPNHLIYDFKSEYEEPNTTNKPTRNTTGTEEEVSSEFLSVNNQDPEFNNKPIRKPERCNQKDILQKDESIITDEPQSEATEPNYESDHTNSEGVDTTNRPEGHFYEWKSEYQKEYNGTIGPWNETKPTSEEEFSLELTSVYHQSPGLKNERIRRPIKRKHETDEEHPSDPNHLIYDFKSEYEEPNTSNKPTRNTTGTEEEVSSEFLSVNNQDPEFNNKPIRKPERCNHKGSSQEGESIITDEPQSEATEPNYESDHTNSEGVDTTNRPEGHFYEWKSEYQKEYNGTIFQVGPWNETKPTSEEEFSLELTSVYHQSPGLKNERIRRPIKRKHETDEEHPSDPNHLIYDFKSEYEEPNTTNKPTRNTTGTEEEVSSEFLSVNNQDPEFNNKPIRKPERCNHKGSSQEGESIITDEPQSEATEPNYESDHTNSEGVDTTNRPEGHFYEWKSEYQKEYNGTIFQVGPWNETKPTSEEEFSLELTSVYHQSPGLKNERIRRPIKRKHETDEEHPSDPNHLIYDFKSEYEEPNTTNKPTRNTTGTEEEVSSEFLSVNNQDPEFNNKPIRKPERCNQKDILQKDESIITDEPQSEATEPNYESDHTNSEGVDTTNRPEGHFYEWKSEYQKEYNGTIGPWNETKPTSEEEFSLELTSVYHQSPGLKNERIRRPIKRKHETDEEHPSDPNHLIYDFKSEYEEPNTSNKPTRNTTGTEEEVSSEFLSVNNQDPEFNNKPIRKPERCNHKGSSQEGESIITDEPQSEATEPNYESDHTNSEGVDTTNRPEGHFYEWKSEYQKEYNGTIFQVGPWNETKPTSEEEFSLELTSVYHQSPGLKNERIRRPIKRKHETDEEHPSDPNHLIYDFKSEYEEPNTTNKPTRNTTGTEEEVSSEFLSVNNQDPEFNNKPIRKPERCNQKDILQKDESIITDEPQSEATEPNYESDHTNSEGVDTTNRPEGHFYEWKSEYQKEYNGTIGPWNETKPTSEEDSSLEFTSVYHQSPGLKNERIRRPIKRKHETDEEHPSDPNHLIYDFKSEYEEPNTSNKPTRNTTGTEEEVSSEFLSVNNQDPEFNNKPIRKPERCNQKDILQKDESIITDEPQSEATEPNYESDHTNSEGVDTTNRPEGHFYEWKSEYQKEYNGTIGPWNETKPTSEEEFSLELTSVYHQSPGLKNERIRRPIKRKHETDEEHPSDPNHLIYDFKSEYEEPNTSNKPTRNTTGTEEEVSSEFLSVNNQDPEFNNKPIRKPERCNHKGSSQEGESIITDEPQSEATEPNYESDHTNSEGVDTTNRPEGHFYEWKSEYQKEYNGTIFQVGPWNETKPTSEEEFSLELTSVYHQSPGLKNERIRRPIKRKHETDEEHPSDPNHLIYDFKSEYEEPNTTNKPTRNTTGTEEEVSSEFLSVNNQDPEFNNKPIRKPERCNQKDILQKDESIITDEPQSEATEPNYESDHTNSEGVDTTNRPEGHFYEWKSEYQKEYNGTIFQVGPWNETKPTSEEEFSLELTSVYHQSPGLKNERIRRPIKRKHETDEEHPSDPNHLIYDFKSEYEEPNTSNKPTRNTTGTEEEVSSEFLSVNNQDPEFNNKPIRKPERCNHKGSSQEGESIITDEPQSEATEPNYESDHTNSEGVDTTNRPEGHFYEWKSEYQKEYNGTIFQVGPWNETKPTSEEEFSLELTSVYHQSPGLKNERIRRPIKRKHETDEEHPSDPNHLIYDFKSEYEEPNTTNKPTRNTTGTEEEVSSEFFSVNNQDPEFNNKPIRKPERCNQKDILQKDESIITDEPQSEATEPNYESDHTNSEGVDTTNRPEGHFYEWKSEYQKEYNGTIFQVGPWNETKPTSEEEFSLELTSVYHQSPGLKNERIRRPIKRKHETDEEHPSDPNHLIYDFKSEYEEPNTTNKPTRNTTGTEEEVSSEFLSVNNQDPEFNNKPIRKPERCNHKGFSQEGESIITDEPQSEATEPNYESDHTNSEGVDTTNRPEGHFYEWKVEYQKEYNGTIGPWNETKPTSEEDSSLEFTSVYHQSPGLKNERIRRPIKRKHETDEEHPSDPNHLIYDFKSEYEEPNTTNKPTRNTTGTEEEVSSEFLSVNNQDPEFNNKPIRKPERCNHKGSSQEGESIITDEPQSEATEPNYESDHTNSDEFVNPNITEKPSYEFTSEQGHDPPYEENYFESDTHKELEFIEEYRNQTKSKEDIFYMESKHENDEIGPIYDQSPNSELESNSVDEPEAYRENISNDDEQYQFSKEDCNSNIEEDLSSIPSEVLHLWSVEVSSSEFTSAYNQDPLFRKEPRKRRKGRKYGDRNERNNTELTKESDQVGAEGDCKNKKKDPIYDFASEYERKHKKNPKQSDQNHQSPNNGSKPKSGEESRSEFASAYMHYPLFKNEPKHNQGKKYYNMPEWDKKKEMSKTEKRPTAPVYEYAQEYDNDDDNHNYDNQRYIQIN